MELHKRRGLSQTEIGKKSSLSQASIYKILAGIGTPRGQTYQKLATAFPEAWSDYIRRHSAFRKELSDIFSGSVPQGMDMAMSRLERFVQSDFGLTEIEDLPVEYRERYRRRLEHLMDGLITELALYRKQLQAQFRKRHKG